MNDSNPRVLMAAVGSGPGSIDVIDRTATFAKLLKLPWIAVHVENLKKKATEDSELERNLRLAAERGAQLVMVSDKDVVRGLIQTARQHRAIQIFIGSEPRSFLKRPFRRSSVVSRLLEESHEIDVVVLRSDRAKKLQLTPDYLSLRAPSSHYLIATAFMLGAVGINRLLEPFLGYWALGLIFLLAMVVQSLFTGRGPILISAVLSAVLWNLLFIPPRFTLYIAKPEDLLLIVVYFIAALVTGTLATRIRAREIVFQSRGQRASALFEFTRKISRTRSVNDILLVSIETIKNTFDSDVAVLLEAAGKLKSDWETVGSWCPVENSMRKAEEAFVSGLPVISSEDPSLLFLPLLISGRIIGVTAVKRKTSKPFAVEERSFIEAVVNQTAISLQREFLVNEAAKTQVLEESERLHKLLLNSLSHELRTPITAIKSAVSNLTNEKLASDPAIRGSLVHEIGLANERLHRLIMNLLDISRLESGHMKPRMEWCDVSDLVNTALASVKEVSGHLRVNTEMSADLPLVFVDYVLMEQALKNLIHNAVVHAGDQDPLVIRSEHTDSVIRISVIDRGPGIDEQAIPHIFEKFYRTPRSGTGGLGLGLAIARGFVELQGAGLAVSRVTPRGTCFAIEIPLRQIPKLDRDISPS